MSAITVWCPTCGSPEQATIVVTNVKIAQDTPSDDPRIYVTLEAQMIRHRCRVTPQDAPTTPTAILNMPGTWSEAEVAYIKTHLAEVASWVTVPKDPPDTSWMTDTEIGT